MGECVTRLVQLTRRQLLLGTATLTAAVLMGNGAAQADTEEYVT
ncbi:hypothetical protein [Moorena sp. SIOASIH]|nr:hypothetical protein [Moorena sp. SIOASIH]